MLVLAAVLASVHLLVTPALWPVDETAHIAYADHLVTELALPEVDDPIPADRPWPGLDQRLGWERHRGYDGRQDIWTANHPPGPSLVHGIALRLGLLVNPAVAILLARLTSVAWFVLAVHLSDRLARRLLPGRPRAALVAPLLVALTPTATHVAGLAFTDAAAMAATIGCLLVGTTIALDGPSPRRSGWLAVAAGGAALTRVSVLPVVLAMLVLAMLGHHRAARRGAVVEGDGAGGAVVEGAAPQVWWRDGLRGALLPAGLAMVPAALFWLRNLVLLGGISGSSALLEKFERTPNDPLATLVTDRFFWLRLWNRMWADLTTGHWNVWPRRSLTELVLLVVLAAAAWHLAVLARRAWAGREDTGPWVGAVASDAARAVRRAHVQVWMVLGGLVAVQVGAVVTFHSAGGSLHGRYLLGVHPLTCIAAAALVGSVPAVGRWALGVLPLLAATTGVWLLTDLARAGSTTWNRGPLQIELPTLLGAWTGPAVMVLALVGLVALGRTLGALWQLPADPVTGWPPAEVRERRGSAGRRAGRLGAAPPA